MLQEIDITATNILKNKDKKEHIDMLNTYQLINFYLINIILKIEYISFHTYILFSQKYLISLKKF